MAVDAPSPQAHGFTLVELLLAAALGLVLFAVACRLLLGEARHGGALAQHLLLRTSQRRTLALIKLDLHRAESWTLTPDAAGPWPCPIGARQPLIAIHMRDGEPDVLYSLGPAPSAIWRGTVLMRCGPSFDLQGHARVGGSYQNRVVLDAIDAFAIEQPSALPVLQLHLEQRLPGRDQRVITSASG